MIVKYKGVEIDCSPAAIKAWVEGLPRGHEAGIPLDGEACLVNEYLTAHLHRAGHAPLIYVGGNGGIDIGTGDDETNYEAENDLLDVIQGFDRMGLACPVSREQVLRHLSKLGVW